MEVYRYTPLDPGCIRLLEFRSLKDTELAFKIHNKKLGSLTTSYAALSYRWGDEDPPAPPRVQIGDGYLYIKPNLRDALVQLKKRFAAKSSLLTDLIWIDAICINQADKNEKSLQVSMMGQIFSQADKVLVWLGNPSDDKTMRLAMEKLAYVQKLYNKVMVKNRPYRPWWWPKDNTVKKDIVGVASKVQQKVKDIFDVEGTDSYTAWRGVVEIWQNPWWERAWVLQEGTVKEPFKTYFYAGVKVHSPKPKVTFMCGEYTTHWDPLIESIGIVDTLLKMPLLSGSTGFLKGASRNVLAMHKIRRVRNVETQMDFLETLQAGRHCKASDPRDKIYATLDLFQQSVRPALQPDYNKSVLDLYLDVARVQLERAEPILDFLGYALRLEKPQREPSKGISHHKWPSWIPNWDDPLALYPLPKKLYARRVSGRGPTGLTRNLDLMDNPAVLGQTYNATRSEKVIAYITGYKLHIQGAIIDTIQETHSYQQGTIAERRERINRWYNSRNKLYPTGQDFNVALLSAQVVDIQRDYISGNAIARGNSLNNPLLEKPLADMTPEERAAQGEMRQCLSFATSYRQLCLTKRGYLGLVPWSARAGDLICMFLGGQVLYVLRLKGDGEDGREYEYLGESFVYALMDGEALDWVRRGNASIGEFVLV